MKLHCPHCGVVGKADDSYAGKTVKCPKCQGMFEAIDKSLSPQLQQQGADGVEKVTLSCPHCGVEGATGNSFVGRKVKCPQCLEMFLVQFDELSGKIVGAVPAPPVMEAFLPQEEIVEPQEAEHVEAIVLDSSSPEEVSVPDVEIEAVPVEEHPQVEMVEESSTQEELIIEPLEAEAVEAALELDDVLEEPLELAQEEDDEVLVDTVPLSDKLPEDLPVEVDEDPAGLQLDEEFAEELELALEAAETDEFEEDAEEEELEYVQQEPYGVDVEQCWQCGKESDGEHFIPRDGRLYCSACVPEKEENVDPADPDGLGLAEAAAAAAGIGAGVGARVVGTARSVEEPIEEKQTVQGEFTIGGMLKEAWEQTKGAKGVIWVGSAVMYLVIFALIMVSVLLLPSGESEIPTATETFGNAIFQAVIDAVSVIFTAGLLFLGIRRVSGDDISWKMVFEGFSSCAGKIIVATILQSILVTIGFLLLIIPGIYLTVAYVMTLPLIVEEGMAPWEAMETSRKAIHKVWWKIAGLLVIMGLLTIVSTIPLGIGLIWTWPMFIILAGVVYRHLFGAGRGL
jgi:phage FluMu protein Com